jgi:uncharacterized protein (TIGR03000 family)
MLRRLVPFLGTAALTLAATSIVAEPAAAQWQGRREGSSYGDSRWYGDRGGYNTGRYWYGGNYGLGLTVGGYSPYYPRYDGPQYTPGTYGYDSNSYSGAPASAYREDGRGFMSPPGDANVVSIRVRVSPNAEIWFDGAKTTQKGSLRQFTSPRLDSDGEHTYEIRALWTEGGREIDQTRNVSFHAGDRLTVNFTTPQAKSTEAIEKRADPLSTLLEKKPVAPVIRDVAPVVRDEEPRQPRVLVAKDAGKSTHDGKVVSIADDKLVMTGSGDSEHSHALTADVKLTCDGKVCKCEDIKAGMRIRVTTKKDDKQTVTRIESLSKNDDFENRD